MKNASSPHPRTFAILTTPPLFIFFVLSLGLLFGEKMNTALNWNGILLWPSNLWIGIPLFILGAMLYTWTIVLFARIGKGTQTPIASTQKLVIVGPYRLIRNPMVLGVICFVVGLGFILNSIGFIALNLIIPFTYLVYIKCIEEKELEARFGKDYVKYKKEVPFLIPRFF